MLEMLSLQKLLTPEEECYRQRWMWEASPHPPIFFPEFVSRTLLQNYPYAIDGAKDGSIETLFGWVLEEYFIQNCV